MTVNGKQLAAAISEASTDEIREGYRDLARDMLRETRRILAHGTPSARQRLLQSVVPFIVRDTLSERHDDDEIREMRAKLDQLAERFRSGVATRPVPVEVDEQSPVDSPDQFATGA